MHSRVRRKYLFPTGTALSYLKTKTHPLFLSPSAFDGVFGKKGGTLTGHYYAAVFLDKDRS